MSNPDRSGMKLETTVTNPLPELVAVVGPSGVGKTAISLEIAREVGGEIVNGDATALYRFLNIGSAKPTLRERCDIAHHLIDIAAPDEIVSVGQYQKLAYAAIDDILDRGRRPLLVGGSGLYIRAVVEGYVIPPVPPDDDLRTILASEVQRRGHTWLQGVLRDLDPIAASVIDPVNTRRVIRAIEVCRATGQPVSSFWEKRHVRYSAVMIGLTRPLSELLARIDARVDLMLEQGLVREVESILDMGYAPDRPALSAIGYREVVSYLDGKMTLDAAISEIKRATRRLARRQIRDWFRSDDPLIHWFDVSTPDAVRCITRFLAS